MEYNNLYEIDERKQLIAGQLIVLRTIKGYSQKDVAEKIGVKPGTYNAYEKARSEPPAEILVRLSFLYDVSVDEIVQRDSKLKDPEELEKKFNEVVSSLKELQTKMDSGEVDTKEVADGLLKLDGQMTKALYEINKIMTNTSNDEV